MTLIEQTILAYERNIKTLASTARETLKIGNALRKQMRQDIAADAKWLQAAEQNPSTSEAVQAAIEEYWFEHDPDLYEASPEGDAWSDLANETANIAYSARAAARSMRDLSLAHTARLAALATVSLLQQTPAAETKTENQD
jgi:hypothetical protein